MICKFTNLIFDLIFNQFFHLVVLWINLHTVFNSASLFNQDLSKWDVSAVSVSNGMENSRFNLLETIFVQCHHFFNRKNIEFFYLTRHINIPLLPTI